MRNVAIVLGAIAVAVALTLVVLPAPAKAEPPPTGTELSGEITAIVSNGFMYQGKLTDGTGRPVPDATYSLTFRLYNVPSGGSALDSDADTVTTQNGLFAEVVNFDTEFFNGQQLYLSVQVGATELPRQSIYPVPYALSLRPGAVISNTTSSQHALELWSNYSGSAGTALWVENSNASSGIALWGRARGSDATIIASNDGSGALFKGFGGDGGDHEFIVYNNGGVWGDGDFSQTRTADGLVKAAVYAMCGNTTSSITRSFNNVGGNITIANGADPGQCTIDFGFKIDDRYFSATAGGSSAARGACCYWGSTERKLNCMRWDADGDGVNGAIMVVIY